MAKIDERFLKALWEDPPPQASRELRLIGPKGASRFLFPSEATLTGTACRANSTNVYVGVALRNPGAKGGREGCCAVRAVWADVDEALTEEALAERVVVAGLPTPSLVVDSGHGYHLYWLLDEWVRPSGFGDIERVNKGIAAVIGADPACHDVSRIMRLPGTQNVKNPDYPRPCVLLRYDLLRYKLATVEAALRGAPRRVAPKATTFREQVPETPQKATALAIPPGITFREQVPETPAKTPATRQAAGQTPYQGPPGWSGVHEGHRHARAIRLTFELREKGLPRAEAQGALETWNSRNEPPLPAEELCQVVAHCFGESPEGAASPSEAPTSDFWTPSELLAAGQETVEYVVDRLVPRRGVTMFTGEGGIGKSFFALDIGIAVASGGAFAGFPCCCGPVLYVDLENDEATLGDRVARLCRGRGVDGDALPLLVPKRNAPGVVLQIDLPEGRAFLLAAIERLKPALVVIDSLIAAHGGDENSNVLMRQLISGLDSMARAGNLGILVVHHQRKRGVVNDAGQLMRGASDLRNAVVSHFAARRQSREVVLLEHDKLRPARPASPFSVSIVDAADGSVAVRCLGTGRDAIDLGSAPVQREACVLARLADGGARTSELSLLIEAPKRTCERTLADLRTKGLIFKWPDGLYRLTSDCPPPVCAPLAETGDASLAAEGG